MVLVTPPLLLVVSMLFVGSLSEILLQTPLSNSSAAFGSSNVVVRKRNTCNIFKGHWVYDPSYPLYGWNGCPYIDPQFDCKKYGRPDSYYLRWKWKPKGCNLPRFNALYMLEKLRGKNIMFVGDSLNRNQWESMICILHSALPQSRISFIRGDPISTFRALDFGVSVMFYRAPYLVDSVKRAVNGIDRAILRLDSVGINGFAWKQADILIFNSGHWWTHTGKMTGWDFLQYGGRLYKNMNPTLAYLRGMTTWGKWIDANINHRKTKVFFSSYSPSHYSQGQGSCYGAKQPTVGSKFGASEYPTNFGIAEAVLFRMRSPVRYLNITLMSMERRDAHPSVYNSHGLSSAQKMNPQRYADCSHWCLPGLPDAWNELLYYNFFS